MIINITHINIGLCCSVINNHVIIVDSFPSKVGDRIRSPTVMQAPKLNIKIQAICDQNYAGCFHEPSALT